MVSGAYTRGGAGGEREGKKERVPRAGAQQTKVSFGSQGFPVGEKTKTVGNWADNPGAVPTVRGDAGARRCPPGCPMARVARGGGVGVGFFPLQWCETGADPHRRREGLTTQKSQTCQARAFVVPLSRDVGTWKQDFSPGGDLVPAHFYTSVQTGNGAGALTDESCLSKLRCGSSGLLNLWNTA